MVDAFVSYAVQKLGDFLIQEVSLRRSLRQDVMRLRKELLFMQSFLKDAEQKQVEDHTVRQWVFEINEIANDSVSILETYSLEAGEGDGDGLANRLKAAEGDGDGLASRLKACACICSDNSFSQLEFLRLQDLHYLQRWHLGTSAMPLIKGFGIYGCPKLKEIPERMKHVEKLKI